MDSSKYQFLRISGSFYLPVVSLAVLTGFVTLPATLALLIPAMESAIFISLPHLWGAFLSWVTPSCLFVLLNGIIVVLTASSGMFQSSVTEVETDFNANLLPLVRKLQSSEETNSRAEFAVAQTRGCRWGDGGGSEVEEKKFIQEEEEGETEEEEGEEEEENPSRLLKVSMASKSFSYTESRPYFLEEEDIQKRGGSEPSSPHYSTPAKNNSGIRRSLSIDSAPVHETEPLVSSEQLSDEAFRKRIEDYISKKKSQLKSEAK